MSALEIAQNTLAAPVTVPKEFLTALAEKYSGTDFDVDELMKDPELMKFAKKAKGRRTVTKKTPPAEERRGEYESHKCDARIWLAVRGMKNTGYSDIQCSSKKVDGCLCKKHAKQLAEDNLWCGLITEDPPEDPVFTSRTGEQKDMVWFNEEEERGERSPRGGVTRPTEASLVKKATKKKPSPKKAEKKKPEKKKPEKKKPEKKKAEKKKAEKKKPEKKKPSPKKSPAKEVGLGAKQAADMSVGELQAILAAKEMVRRVGDNEQEDLESDTEDLEDENEDEEEEEEYEQIDFEGVEYLMDPKNGDVHDAVSMEKIGTWNADDEEVEWDNDDAFEAHQEKVDE